MANSLSPANSPQALVACSHLGSIWGFWRLQPSVYQALHRLQEILQTLYHTRPILGQEHDRFRSISGPMENVIDGELVLQFLDLELVLQLEAIEQSAGTVESYLRQWVESVPMTAEERQVFDDYAQALADKYPAVAAYVFAKNKVEEEEEEEEEDEADGDSLAHDSCTKEPTRSSSEILENVSDSPNASQESVASTSENLPRVSQEVEDEKMQLDDTVEATSDEVVATEPDPAEVLKLWWAFGTLHNLLEFLRSLQWHQ
ncbi:hypothetical protein BGW42_008058 [Actinomortierella wolfii]|nr:hypothetical protein BGW42_008058 [Actinomortierella wolfii]